MKSKVRIIITIVPSYTRKNITCLLPLVVLLVLHTYNNTECNKLVIFSGRALYYDDTHVILNKLVYSTYNYIIDYYLAEGKKLYFKELEKGYTP